MNLEKPSREEIEAKLTALLLGELPAEEAQLLRWAVSQDAALAQLHDRLKLTVGFVREVAANPAETTVAQSAPLKLSDERREKLLAHFKTVRPIILLPPLPPKRREVSSFLVMVAAVALIAVLAAMLLPSLAAAKRKAQRSMGQYSLVMVKEKPSTAPVAQNQPENFNAVPTTSDEAQPNPDDYVLARTPMHALDSGGQVWVRKSDRAPAPPEIANILNQEEANKSQTALAENQNNPPAASEQRLESAEAYFQNGDPTAANNDSDGDGTVNFALANPSGANDATTLAASGYLQVQKQTTIVLPAGETDDKELAAANPASSDTAGKFYSGLTHDDVSGLRYQANIVANANLPKAGDNWSANNTLSGFADNAITTGPERNAAIGKLKLDRVAGGAGGGGFGNKFGGGGGGGSFGGESGGGGGGGTAGNFQQRLQSIIDRRENSEMDNTVAFDGAAKQDGFNFDSVKSDAAQNEPKNVGGFYTGLTKDDVSGSRDSFAPQSSVAQNQAAGEKRYYRVQAEPDAAADKVPMLGDMPLVAGQFESRSANGEITVYTSASSPASSYIDATKNLGMENLALQRNYAPDVNSVGTIQTPSGGQLVYQGNVADSWGTSGGSIQAPVVNADGSIQTPVDIVASGGSEASQNVPASAANPLEKFPGNTAGVVVAPSASDQLIAGGLRERSPVINVSAGTENSPGDHSITYSNAIVSDTFQVADDKFYSGLTKDDVSNLRYLTTTNSVQYENNGTFGRAAWTAAPVTTMPAPPVVVAQNTFVGQTERLRDSAVYAPTVAPLAPAVAAPGFIDRKAQLGVDAYAGQQAELQNKNIQLNYASPSNIQLAIQSSLTDNRSKVVVDSGTGELAISGTEQEIQSTENLVSQLDKPSRQMLIENGLITNSVVATDEGRLIQKTSLPAPQLYTRTFKIDPNTFYQSLQKVGTFTFGSANNNGGGRSGGLDYTASVGQMQTVGVAAQTFFKTLGVDLSSPGKNIFFNDRSGQLFVRGTAEDLDVIQSAVQAITKSPAAAPVATDVPLPKTPSPAPIPQPEFLTSENRWSTFSLNVSDVSYKLAAASLEKGQLPDAASIRSEEFINAFDYHDPEPAAGVPVAFVAERARDPFTQNRDLLRFSIKTAAAGREAGRPLNIVLLLDNSGSMERADRVAIIHEALKVLASQLQPQDTISIVTFARTARLWVDGARGDQAGTAVNEVSNLTPEGGTNLEDAMNLAYATARRHYLAKGVNRVVLLTDGAANLGNVDPEVLKQKVELFRKQGIALDCFGIGWEGYNDDLLEVLSSNGDGRYGFINTPEAATTEFAAQLAGALHVAAEDVKVQVEFNPQRVISWRQIGYAKHQLTKEQFRDNTVAAAPLAAREAGNALYTVEINPQGSGPVATVRVRFRIPGTQEVSEHEWQVPFDGNAPALEQASAALRLAATASAFSEWLTSSPFAQEVTTDQLLNYLSGVPAIYGADPRPKQLETMIREAKSLSGK